MLAAGTEHKRSFVWRKASRSSQFIKAKGETWLLDINQTDSPQFSAHDASFSEGSARGFACSLASRLQRMHECFNLNLRFRQIESAHACNTLSHARTFSCRLAIYRLRAFKPDPSVLIDCRTWNVACEIVSSAAFSFIWRSDGYCDDTIDHYEMASHYEIDRCEGGPSASVHNEWRQSTTINWGRGGRVNIDGRATSVVLLPWQTLRRHQQLSILISTFAALALFAHLS